MNSWSAIHANQPEAGRHSEQSWKIAEWTVNLKDTILNLVEAGGAPCHLAGLKFWTGRIIDIKEHFEGWSTGWPLEMMCLLSRLVVDGILMLYRRSTETVRQARRYVDALRDNPSERGLPNEMRYGSLCHKIHCDLPHKCDNLRGVIHCL